MRRADQQLGCSKRDACKPAAPLSRSEQTREQARNARACRTFASRRSTELLAAFFVISSHSLKLEGRADRVSVKIRVKVIWREDISRTLDCCETLNTAEISHVLNLLLSSNISALPTS